MSRCQRSVVLPVPLAAPPCACTRAGHCSARGQQRRVGRPGPALRGQRRPALGLVVCAAHAQPAPARLLRARRGSSVPGLQFPGGVLLLPVPKMVLPHLSAWQTPRCLKTQLELFPLSPARPAADRVTCLELKPPWQ